jgi:hypothetical protein
VHGGSNPPATVVVVIDADALVVEAATAALVVDTAAVVLVVVFGNGTVEVPGDVVLVDDDTVGVAALSFDEHPAAPATRHATTMPPAHPAVRQPPTRPRPDVGTLRTPPW